MSMTQLHDRSTLAATLRPAALALLAPLALALTACASGTGGAPADDGSPAAEGAAEAADARMTHVESGTPPVPDLRVGLEAGRFDAGAATWNMELVTTSPTPEPYRSATHSDLAFQGDYVIQGNYAGILIWDVSDPSDPTLRTTIHCPASQNDVSVYGDLLFVSTEGLNSRVDCGDQGVEGEVSADRMRGVRIFDIGDLDSPELIRNVQTCRGSHTHTLLVDPDDSETVYVYVQGSAPVRPSAELEGCSDAMPEEDPESALFRLDVIEVPVDRPEEASIVSNPRIFEDLEPAPEHGMTEAERREHERQLAEARAEGAFIVEVQGVEQVAPTNFVRAMLDSIASEREAGATPTAADSAALRESLQAIVDDLIGDQPETGPTQCHDITTYPAIGRAAGPCEGYGFLLDITDPTQPTRLDAVADSNFAYWHAATFDNPGETIVFTDEWGGGGQPKCRDTDPYEWGANAIFSRDGDELVFESYFKMPAPQTEQENCVAHNGSLVPVPGRDIMVQSWYQGGVSVFEFTDPANPREIAYFDRGPVNAEEMTMGGAWSTYWYNGRIYSSEISRGLDVLELTPSPLLTENELEAARSVEFERFNAQMQPRIEWPASYAKARAYVDQLERSGALADARIRQVRETLAAAEMGSSSAHMRALVELADRLEAGAELTGDPEKVRTLAETMRELAETSG
jgi:hypothetical protein